jgi:methyltransferase (TIGR00027 family)
MPSTPSPTALLSAAARAAHLHVDVRPYLLVDDLAERLMGESGRAPLDYHRRFPTHPVLAGARTSALLRSRFAEDLLAASPADQYVVLGAGLDTSALRTALGRRVFEFDRPGVLTWRRAALAAAQIPVPSGFRDVPVELGRDPLRPALLAAGLDPRRPAFVSWLGTTMYLTDDEVRRTLGELSGLAPGSELVLDHVLAADARDDAGSGYAAAVSAAAGDGGEPWRSSPAPATVRTWLVRAGFGDIAMLPDHEAVGQDAWHRSDALRPIGLIGLVRARIEHPHRTMRG